MNTTTEKGMHTPGPWHVISDGPPAKLFNATVIFSEHIDDAIICSIGGDVPYPDANARLIAAAPELLAALERIDDLDPKGIACREGCACMGCIARAAIRKAKGEAA